MPNMVIYDKSFTLSIKEDLFVFRKIRRGNAESLGLEKNIAITTKTPLFSSNKVTCRKSKNYEPKALDKTMLPMR